jgi:prepilin-type N-terminal cleavage/methylation domain-containing protein
VRQAGFTLVELMVVVIILGLIGGVALTSWASLLPNQRFNTAVRNLSEVLYDSRSRAIAQNREYRIQYDLEEDVYRVRTPFTLEGGGFATTENDDERQWIRVTDLGEMGIDIVQVTIDDRKFQDGQVDVIFYPLGASSYHTIHLRQTLFEREFTLELLPLTGEIRLHDGPFERDPVDEGDFR